MTFKANIVSVRAAAGLHTITFTCDTRKCLEEDSLDVVNGIVDEPTTSDRHHHLTSSGSTESDDPASIPATYTRDNGC